MTTLSFYGPEWYQACQDCRRRTRTRKRHSSASGSSSAQKKPGFKLSKFFKSGKKISFSSSTSNLKPMKTDSSRVDLLPISTAKGAYAPLSLQGEEYELPPSPESYADSQKDLTIGRGSTESLRDSKGGKWYKLGK